MKLINCTPHPINLIREDGTMISLEKGVVVPRVQQESAVNSYVDGVPVTEDSFGSLQDMPLEAVGTRFIVSRMVLEADKKSSSPRADLLVPGALVRDENGNIVGCKSLSCC